MLRPPNKEFEGIQQVKPHNQQLKGLPKMDALVVKQHRILATAITCQQDKGEYDDAPGKAETK